MTDCVNEYCGAGDLSDDLVALKTMYASYCYEAGYTQYIIASWIGVEVTLTEETTSKTTTKPPSSGPTATDLDDGSTSTTTTTDVTISTQTPAPSDSATEATLSKFLVLLSSALAIILMTILVLLTFSRHLTQFYDHHSTLLLA